MKDLNVIFGDFNTTTVTIEAVSKRGKSLFVKEFGAGAVSITLPKSKAPDFTEYAANHGLVWQSFTQAAYTALYATRGAPVSVVSTNQGETAQQ